MADNRVKTNKAVLTEGQMDVITKTTGEMLAEQPKVKIRLYQAKPPEKPLPDETVCVNGYIYQIKRGEYVEVPETVAKILEEAGRI